MNSNVKKQVLWIGELLSFNIRSIFEYKSSFVMQVIGMMINNLAFIIVWYLFFQIFKSVNGWEFKEMIGVNGFVALIYGIVFTFGNGVRKISRNVTYGQLDKYLLLPKNALLSIILSDAHVSAIGDMLFGLVSLIIYCVISNFNVVQLLVIPLLLLFSIMIFVGFIIVAQSVVFWIPNSEELSETLFEFMLGPSLYPNSSFTGIVRIFFSFFIPALFISGIPINIILNLNLLELGLMFVIGFVWLWISFFIFKLGLKKYESGNLVGVR